MLVIENLSSPSLRSFPPSPTHIYTPALLLPDVFCHFPPSTCLDYTCLAIGRSFPPPIPTLPCSASGSDKNIPKKVIVPCSRAEQTLERGQARFGRGSSHATDELQVKILQYVKLYLQCCSMHITYQVKAFSIRARYIFPGLLPVKFTTS